MLLALAALVSAPQQAMTPAPQLLRWAETTESLVAEPGDQFGHTLAVGGDRAVVNAWQRAGGGGADVLRWTGNGLVHEATLTPAGLTPGAMCGITVDINDAGDVAVLASQGDDTNGSNAGAVHVFRRQGTQWTEEAKLLAPDGAASDRFGGAVAVGEDVVVIGAPGVDVAPFYYGAGAVYVFSFDGSTWTPAPRLTLPDLDIGDGLGESIALDGGRFAAGVPKKDSALGDNAGAVALFERGPAGWTHVASLAVPGLGAGDGLGRAVALSGDVVLASSIAEAPQMSGVVHAFARLGGAWTEVDRFRAPTPGAFDFFGETLALRGTRALVSARGGSGATSSFVHSYALQRDGGRLLQTLAQGIPVGAHVFKGSDVALGRGFAVVGEATTGATLGARAGFVDVYGAEPRTDAGAVRR